MRDAFEINLNIIRKDEWMYNGRVRGSLWYTKYRQNPHFWGVDLTPSKPWGPVQPLSE
jgi:hypothetical protein